MLEGFQNNKGESKNDNNNGGQIMKQIMLNDLYMQGLLGDDIEMKREEKLETIKSPYLFNINEDEQLNDRIRHPI